MAKCLRHYPDTAFFYKGKQFLFLGRFYIHSLIPQESVTEIAFLKAMEILSLYKILRCVDVKPRGKHQPCTVTKSGKEAVGYKTRSIQLE